MTVVLDNPYLAEVDGLVVPPGTDWRNEFDYCRLEHRPPMVDKYSWAVPSTDAIEAIAAWSPIVEIGAGTGYWAWLLRQAGADVVAYDFCPPSGVRVTDEQALKSRWLHEHRQVVNPWHYTSGQRTWTEVERGTPFHARRHPDRTLFLCWPPMSSMALRALRWGGTRVAYVGEQMSGCTASDDFFLTLEKDYEEVDEIRIPCWFGIRDRLMMFERR